MNEHERRLKLDAHLQRMRGLIDEHGVAIQMVGAGGRREPSFAYTVGLAALGQPEFILFGLSPEVSQTLLNDLAKTVLDRSTSYAHGDTVHELVRGFPVRLVQVSNSRTHLTVANRFYSDAAPGGAVSALQVVYPDAQQRWPWRSGSGVSAMPLLGPVPGDEEGTQQTVSHSG